MIRALAKKLENVICFSKISNFLENPSIFYYRESYWKSRFSKFWKCVFFWKSSISNRIPYRIDGFSRFSEIFEKTQNCNFPAQPRQTPRRNPLCYPTRTTFGIDKDRCPWVSSTWSEANSVHPSGDPGSGFSLKPRVAHAWRAAVEHAPHRPTGPRLISSRILMPNLIRPIP